MSHNKPITLSPHLAELIHIQGVEVAIDLKHQRQSHGHLRRCHGQNEQEHNLAVGLMPSRSGDYERQPAALSITSNDIRMKSRLRRTSRLVSPSENKIPASISPSLIGICVMLNLRFHGFQEGPGDKRPTTPASNSMEASSTPIT
jgi:hypothetical protein